MDASRGASAAPQALVLLLPGPRLDAAKLERLLGHGVVREITQVELMAGALALAPDLVVVDGSGPLAGQAAADHIVLAADEPLDALVPRLRAALGGPQASYL